jgi:hypothetical protein
MAEYIEREAISEEIRKYYYKNPPNFSYGEGFDRGLDRAQRAILDAPAADVAPVRHGRWIDKGEYAVCTECGGRSGTQYDGVEPIPLMTQFCPNCGARMDGGNN